MDKLLLGEQEKFKAIFQNASIGILVVNQQGEIILANSFVVNQFGYDNQEEIIGQKVEVLIPKRYRVTHVEEREQFQEAPETRPMGIGRDLFGVKKNGTEIPLEISLSSYKSEDKIFTIAFVIDITVRVEIQNKFKEQRQMLAKVNIEMEHLNEDLEKKVQERTSELRKTMEKLAISKDNLTKALSKEKELNEMKSSFVSMASHEFRTPLSTILSSATLLAKYKLSEEQAKRDKHVQRIKSSVVNLNNILNEFLVLGRLEEGKVKTTTESIDITFLVSSQYQEMSDIFKEGQKVEYHHKGDTFIKIDPTLFRNVIINLLSNAIKFSPPAKTIYINTEVSKELFIFAIRDQGMGISQKDQEHLFEIFFRGFNAENIPGTGLGLHIVAKYVEMMHGKVNLSSKLNEGTHIQIEIPL